MSEWNLQGPVPVRQCPEEASVRREDLARSDCGIAQSLGVLGDWWTVLLVREVAGAPAKTAVVGL